MAKNKQFERVLEFENKLGITFNKKELLILALTHSSYVRRRGMGRFTSDNERLEFFGDAVLKLVVSEYLYQNYPNLDEGDLTKIRAQIVSDRMLAQFAKDLKLGEYILFSYGEENAGGKDRQSNLAGAVEAILGALYLDSGIEEAKKFFFRMFSGYEKQALLDGEEVNYKTTLQETLQQQRCELPLYNVLKEEGPEHEKFFYVEAEVLFKGSSLKAVGKGNTKKEAEQAAARRIMIIIDKPNNRE